MNDNEVSFALNCLAANEFEDVGVLKCTSNQGHQGSHVNGSYRWEDTQLEPHIQTPLTLRVSEIFYSLQGEGGRAGEPSIFIRLQGCSAKNACAAGGVVCDTEFESGQEMTLSQVQVQATLAIARAITPTPEVPGQEGDRSKNLWIVWTGGEPLDQLNEEILRYFRNLGYKQAIETSGIRRMSQMMSRLIDYVCVSPKVAEHILAKNYRDILFRGKGADLDSPALDGLQVDELRYVRHAGQPGIPQPSIKARYYYLSPHSDGNELNRENLEHCMRLCLENPPWRLSPQLHKVWGVL